MGISWGALAGAFLAPFLYSLYWKKTTKIACWVCFIFGPALMVVNMLAKDYLPDMLKSPINCGAFAMLAGFVIVPIVSLITPKPDKKLVDDIFSVCEVEVKTTAKHQLDESK